MVRKYKGYENTIGYENQGSVKQVNWTNLPSCIREINWTQVKALHGHPKPTLHKIKHASINRKFKQSGAFAKEA